MNNLVVNSILIICYQRLGDVLLTTPLINSLKTKFPNAMIDIMLFKATDSIVTSNKDINQIIIWDKEQKIYAKFKQLISIYKKYDLAFAITANDRAFFHAILAGKFKVAYIANGVSGKIRNIFLNKSINIDNLNDDLHQIQKINLLGKLLEIKTHNNIQSPVLSDGKFAKDISTYNISTYLNSSKKKIVIHPYPKFNYKKWDLAKWIELCKLLQKQNYQIAISGSTHFEEQQYINEIIENFQGDICNISQNFTFAQISEILRKSDLYIGVDTVTSHLAAGIGIKTIALFGPTNPVWWGAMPKDYQGEISPWKKKIRQDRQKINNVAILQSQMSCVPCHLEGCEKHVDSYSKCLSDISVERVFKEVLAELN